VATGQELITLQGALAAEVLGVTFSPDGSLLATAIRDGTVQIWDGRPWDPKASVEREALGVLEFLFTKPLCRSDVLEHLNHSPTIRPEARQRALSWIDRYREETDPEPYYQASWNLARQPYLNAFQYRFALLQAEHACTLAPTEGRYRTALGAAQYRAGHYQEALTTLMRADQPDEDSPVDLAFLAMTQHQLSQMDQAQTTLRRVRDLVAQPRWIEVAEAHGLLHETEALIDVSVGATVK
jgi:tetratricopeptide (TPR) repeat protein